LGCHQERDGFFNQSKVVLIREVPFDKVFPSKLPLNKLISISLESISKIVFEENPNRRRCLGCSVRSCYAASCAGYEVTLLPSQK
jgi:hypothetical protein